MKALSVKEFQGLMPQAIIIDTRQPEDFTPGFVPGAINIGLGKHFVEWMETLVPAESALLLVANQTDLEDTYEALRIMGYNNILGHLDGGFTAWTEASMGIDMIIDIPGDELALDIPFDNKLMLVDVRSVTEFEQGHLLNAENLPLAQILNPLHLAQLDEDSNIYVYCGGGYRSVVACSIMKKEGFHNIRNVLGGYAALKDTENIPLELPKKK